MLVTGSSDHSLALWDLRQLNRSVHSLSGHADNVLQASWSPHVSSVLASCSEDRRVHVWDLSLIGAEQSAEDAADGPPELLFVHGGHCNRVSDVAWSPNVPWLVGSVSEDNTGHVWAMASEIYQQDDDAMDTAESGSSADDSMVVE